MQAQKQTTYQKLLWTRASLGLQLSEKLDLDTEVEERRFVFPGKQHQVLFRGTLFYNLSKDWKPGIGFTYFLQSPHDPRASSSLMIPELRPHQEMNYRLKIDDRWQLRQRFKLEQRFYRNIENGKLAKGYSFNFRFRLRMEVYYTLLKDAEKKDRLLLTVSDEILLNAGERIVYNVFDQNRLYGGLRWQIGDHSALDGGYLWWFQQRLNGSSFYHRDIVRFSFSHKVSLLKKGT